eukprot:TRINITY_DN32083_c0_g1_i1.p1 TRINITY_DN32083_c0_g1~~TRINITY_DN32083_c0_g1_i1.p1  ORF type:complete len:481 (+),score=93.72 TRINITY_DN32083_c0_g1_i1:40-1443(+)
MVATEAPWLLDRRRPKRRSRRRTVGGLPVAAAGGGPLLTSLAASWIQRLSAAATAATSHDRAAAEGAAAYWRGGRVVAADEERRYFPEIGSDGTIDYFGQDNVQECLEYYVDKHWEEELRRRLTRQELDAAAKGSSGAQAGTARGVVTYLLMENAERTQHRDLLLSLHCLGHFFSTYPVIIFHTDASTDIELQRLRREAPASVSLSLELVSLDFPPSVADAPGGPNAFLGPPRCRMDGRHWWSSNRSCGCRCPAWRPQCWPVNWMHATRFFTAGMFRTQSFQSGAYDFFMRLDTDLFFVEQPVADPLALMAGRGCAMVYDKLSRETPGCFDGFEEMTLNYAQRSHYAGPPDDSVLNVGRGPAAAGGQWTAGDLRLFGSNAYLDFADFAASGIYTDRWADQLILVRGLALFGPRAGEAGRRADAPNVSICVRSLFDAGYEQTGFVHTKGGFRDATLLSRCKAEHVDFG